MQELEKIPAIKYTDRQKLWSYLSFRHVNGPRGWSAISKAEYVAHLHKGLNISFNEILISMGDRNKTSIKIFKKNYGKVIFKKIHEQIGGSIKLMVSGGAGIKKRGQARRSGYERVTLASKDSSSD